MPGRNFYLMPSSEDEILADTWVSCLAPDLPSGCHLTQFLNLMFIFTSFAAKQASPVPWPSFTHIQPQNLALPCSGHPTISLGYSTRSLSLHHHLPPAASMTLWKQRLELQACKGFPPQRPRQKLPKAFSPEPGLASGASWPQEEAPWSPAPGDDSRSLNFTAVLHIWQEHLLLSYQNAAYQIGMRVGFMMPVKIVRCTLHSWARTTVKNQSYGSLCQNGYLRKYSC